MSGGVSDTSAQDDSSPQQAPRDGATQGSEPPQDEPEHDEALGGPEYVFDTKRIVARRQGRDAWPRERAASWRTSLAAP